MRLLFILPFLTMFVRIQGQAEDVKFYHINYNEGLSQSTVNCILKDNLGYYWFGTNDGLNRWNGHQFKVYYYDEGNPNSVGQGRINDLYQDKNGYIWIATYQGGLSRYNPEYDYFENYTVDLMVDCKKIRNSITDIQAFKGFLMLGTFGDGIYLFSPKEKQFIKVSLFDENYESIDNSIINGLYYDEDSVLWIGFEKGVLRVDNWKTNRNDAILAGKVYLKNQNVLEIYEDLQKTLWFGTFSSGAFRFSKTGKQTEHLVNGTRNGHNLSHSIVRKFCEDKSGNLWIGTGGGGINVYNDQSKIIKYYTHKLEDQYSIGSNIIYSFYVDSDKNIMIGTYNGGVSHTNWYKQSFHHEKSVGSNDDLTNNSILAICETTDGKIWFGTDGGGLHAFDPGTGRYQKINLASASSKSGEVNVVTTIRFDGGRKLYIGTYRKGLYIYDIYDKQIRNFSTANGFNGDDVWDIALDKNGEVWIATLGDGLFRYSPKTDRYKQFNYTISTKNSLPDNFLSSILIDHHNNLWVGTYHYGLCRMEDRDKGIFKLYSKGTKGSISSNEIRVIFEDSDNRLWIGTQDGGLNQYISDELGFIVYNQKSGLQGNTVQAIQEDKYRNLWLSTNNGISKMDVENDTATFKNFSMLDGLQSNEFNMHSSMLSDDGRIFFGGLNGYNSFSPDEIIFPENSCTTLITRLLIFDKIMEPGKKGSILQKSIEYTDKIVLSPKQSTITLEFALLDYTVPQNNIYKYRLVPYEENWINAGNQNRATYTNLDPGKYKFQVTGINSNGVESKNTATLEIIVNPPYWMTWWFRLIVILVIIFMLLTIYRIRINALQIKRDMLSEIVEERIKELKSLNRILEDRNSEINSQSDTLNNKQRQLVEAYRKLDESIKQIEKQNTELQEHRNNLEMMVQQRTTELGEAKRKAEESEKLKMVFLSNMSHEIRTPMNAIIGFASLLSEEDAPHEEKLKYIKQININSESLLVLVDDILDLSKIEANQLSVRKNTFDFNQFINEIYSNWQQIKKGRLNQVQLLLINHLLDKKNSIHSDPVRLRQVINNLIDNAYKFTLKGKISIEVISENNHIHITITDTGIGIPKEIISTIFDRFRKGDDMSENAYRGAGLGLTISKKIVELLEGKIWVESIPAKGSTFHLVVPVGNNLEINSKDSGNIDVTIIEDDLKAISVLVAEDEDANFYYLRNILEKKGAIIDWAKNGEETIKMTAVKNYDIILMDIKMPVINGIEAAQKIKSIFPDQKIIAQTAFARQDEENEIRKYGFDDYISKPIQGYKLIKIILNVLKRG